jgi:hypothetical protein
MKWLSLFPLYVQQSSLICGDTFLDIPRVSETAVSSEPMYTVLFSCIYSPIVKFDL